jgi:phage terminase large subunit-like protein
VSQLIELLRLEKILLAELEKRQGTRLLRYEPYPKQLEFHHAKQRERVFMSGNQTGKSESGAAEAAMHLTGLYPEWWCGKRFHHPVRMWIGGVTGEVIRDSIQRKLVGEPEGTGYIPKDLLLKKTMSRGISGQIDSLWTRWGPNKQASSATFKSYEQGRTKWQAETVDIIWLDEEPPQEIFGECMARISASKGILYMTFTPLMGVTEVVREFMLGGNPQRTIIQMEIQDALHFTPEERQLVIDSYPEHEREARAYGRPILGSGMVFPVAESKISHPTFQPPAEWPRICAIDFGIAHPTALVWGAHDKENDIIYIYDCWRENNASAMVVSDVIRTRLEWVPVVYPHDGDNREKGSGETLADQYRKRGVNMLSEAVTFEGGGRYVEPGIQMMTDRMLTGRLKVFDRCVKWFEELRQYHRKDGQIVKEHDDLMAATRYLVMGIRYAMKGDINSRRRKKPDYEFKTKAKSTWKVS